MSEKDYPFILTSIEVAEIMRISRKVAYEIMERKDFPLIRIGTAKKVNRDKFFKWLEDQEQKQG
jgi:predicted DNA-binding transcriptional regulator AlpA